MWVSKRTKACLFVSLVAMVTATCSQPTNDPGDEVEDSKVPPAAAQTEATSPLGGPREGAEDDVGPQTSPREANSSLASLERIAAECGDRLPCAQDRLAKLVDSLDERPSVSLVPGLATLEKTSSSAAGEAAANDDDAERGGDPGARLAGRIARYLRTHVVEVCLSQGAERVVSRVLGSRHAQLGIDVITSQDQTEGRGRIRKLVLPLVLLLNLKAFVLVPIFVSAVALIAFKGLWAGLAAFLVSGAIGLRQLFKGNDDQGPSTRFTVGVVKPHIVPEVYHHGPDYWHGWSRSGPPLPRPAHHDAYPYRGYYPPPSAAWGDRPLVSYHPQSPSDPHPYP